MKVVSVSAGSLVVCVSAAVLLVAKGFARLLRPRMVLRGRLFLVGPSSKGCVLGFHAGCVLGFHAGSLSALEGVGVT